MVKGERSIVEITVDGVKREASVRQAEADRFTKDVNAVLDALGFSAPGCEPPDIPSLMEIITRHMVVSSSNRNAPYSSLARLLNCTKSSVRHFSVKALDAMGASAGLLFTSDWCAGAGEFPVSACFASFIVENVASDYMDGSSVEEICESFRLPARIVEAIINELGVQQNND